MQAPAFRPHDHRACRGAALEAVEAACRGRKLRLTPARACVLEALLESHRALTAYQLRDWLARAGLASQPPVVYRALAFLTGHGFAHRIERLGAYVACTHGGEAHAAAFLVCRACRRVAETAPSRGAAGLGARAAAAGFAVERVVVEAEGLCAGCRGSAA